LLVSVRSAAEAEAAVAGGATVIDVKEPDRGPLGRADAAVWREVRAAVPPAVPVSVALGELREWVGGSGRPVTAEDFSGVAFRKVGLSHAGACWARDWGSLRREWGGGPAWVAVAYDDWRETGAPSVEAVLDAAVAIPECAGLLIDTFDKARRLKEDRPWASLIERAHASGRFVALAGGLAESAIARLAPLGPDLFAVRGAACRGGDRRAPIDPGRVMRLAQLAGSDRGGPLAR
jgi:uncharacterized protein (UPF0264 family)